ncbi:uncharacterized protein BDV17DRAFT_52245 [Aspergillus undulatus]|uniref:uncharacterized protein n=1 Tax=Aspergillus undulatus TaxID=1810928 RepID=UPI003CCD8375
MSENPAQQLKDQAYNVASASGQWAQESVVNPVHAYVAGEEKARDLAGKPAEQVRDTVVTAASASGEWAQQNVVKPVQTYVSGDKNAEVEQAASEIPDDEREKIDNMEKEKVARFLQERHKSSAPIKHK